MLIAVGALSAILVIVLAIYRPWWSSPVTNESPAPADPALSAPETPVVSAPLPAPAPIAPPPSLSDAPATDPRAADLIKAYAAFNANRVDDAARIAATIKKRDPKYKEVEGLLAAITTRRANEEKQKLAVAAAAAAAAAAPPPAPAKPLADPIAPASPVKEDMPTVLPGGGFAANSEPISPLTAGQAARPEIEAAVQEWAKALSTRSIPIISNIRSFTPAEARNWTSIFKNYKAVQVTVRLTGDPEVRDDQAIVPVQESHILTQKDNIKITQQYSQKYRLHKVDDKWRLLPP